MGRRNAARLVAVVATLAVTGVGAAAPASAVSGGALAAGTYPFVAKITMDGRACTGVLIDPQWVLSAASCFPGTPQGGVPSPAVTVTMGRADLAATGGQVAHAKTLVRRSDRDLMLIQLDATVAAAAAAPLALGATTPAAGEALRIAGYGRTEAEWVPNQVHSSTFSVASSTATSVALTGDNGADTCKGDAGGPVWRDGGGHPELVAISATSWQHGCLGVTDTRQGSTATRTDDLSDWLRQQMLAPQARAVADHTITLSWNPVAGQGYTSYRVYGATTPDVPVGSATLLATTAATTFTHGPLPARQTWYYRVVGVTAAGQAGPSSVVVSGDHADPHHHGLQR
jgi:V8-like Glu-specific endopeptidase